MEVNRVLLTGYVEDPPTVHYFGYEHVRVDFRLRTEEELRGPMGDILRTVTTYHSIVAWGSVAERMEMTVLEGQLLSLAGRLTYDRRSDRDGISRTYPVIECQDFTIVEAAPLYDSNSKAASTTWVDDDLDWSAYRPSDDGDDPLA